MRKYIIIALVLLLGGVAASLYLIPSSKEVAGGGAQSATLQTVDVSKLDVEAEYAKGVRSFAVINALADKRSAAGDRPAAVKLLEEYVTANPSDVGGHKKLAQLYRATNNKEGYNKEIEAIAAAAPTEENLRSLSDLYNADKEYVKQAAVLQKILDVTKGEKPQTFVDLATIQVVVGDSDGALKTVEALRAKHPQFSSYPMTRILVSVLADKGEVDRAFDIAKQWIDTPGTPVASPVAPAAPTADTAAPAAPLASAAVGEGNPRPKELADLCNILHYSGHADKAVALVDLHPEMLEREPTLVLAYVNANITAGKSDHAYEVLKKIDDAGQMIAALYPPYLSLTIKREDIPAAEAIATKLDVTGFTEDLALSTIEVARANSAPSVLTILTTRFGDAQVISDKPVLAAVIAILTNDKAQDTKIETALNTQLTSTQRIRLAESCARAKKTACFDAIVKQYPPLEQMTPAQVAEYAQLFIIADRQAELVDPVGKLLAVEHPAAQVATAHRRLSAAAGRFDVLKPWLEANANAVPVAQLQELFYLANDRQHGEVASDIAERLYARDPSPINRNILVSAFIGAGAYDKALPYLREQLKEPGSNDGLYLSTLNKLGRKDASARKELADYAQAALQSGHGDDRQQLNYAYILINNGRKAQVIPYAKNNAATKGGEWKKMYAQLTDKPKAGVAGKPVKLSREQLVAMAASPSISAANKRQVAFTLLNDGYKAEAIEVFKDLAKNAGPDSQEVKDLLYLWGGKLNGPELAWVQNRAATANAYDKQRWAELVGNVADDASVLSYVSATPDALYSQPLRKKYFGILANTGSRQNYDTAMRDWVAQTTDVPALLDYASIGQASGFKEAAANGYARVLALDPNNAKALSRTAALDFGKGKYSSAEKNLNQYMAVQQQAPDAEGDVVQAHFYKAELLRRQGKTAAAQAEYQQVVALTAQTGATAPDALSRLYTAQFRLGQHADAKAGFNQLLEQYPDNKGILADYMSSLIEFKYLDEATRIANQYDKNSPYYRKGASLMGHSAHTASIQQLSGGREIKLSFNQPIEGASPIDAEAATKLAWVEKSSVDYDSLTISAKPGYVVRYVPTSDEQFAVVAEQTPNYAPQVEAQRQQDLRLQLLYARIEQESGQGDKARARLAAVRHYYPNDPQLLSYEASLASADGEIDTAKTLIAQARAAAPENENLSLQEQNISKVNAGTSYVKLDHEYRSLGKNDEQITTLSGVANASRNVEFGFTAQNDGIDTNNTRRARDGRIDDYSADRQRGELYAAYKFDNGVRTQASLFANNDRLGGGAFVTFNNPLGRTELIGEYQRPYWDFVEAVYEDTTRDRVGFKHYARPRASTGLGLELSYNNYSISERDDVAQSVLFRANVVQDIQKQTESQPYLGVGYGFDGEYITGGKPDGRLDGFNNFYYLLPIRTREIHALTGIYRNDWTPSTHALVVAGVAYSRFTENFTPLAEIRVDQDITDNWQIGGRARYAQETNDTSNNQLNLGADILYKF
jgi:cellulose synthase operon protein C